MAQNKAILAFGGAWSYRCQLDSFKYTRFYEKMQVSPTKECKTLGEFSRLEPGGVATFSELKKKLHFILDHYNHLFIYIYIKV